MEHNVNVAIKANVSAQKVWEVLKDFSSIEKFAPKVNKSVILEDKNSGLGAKRKCSLSDGSSVVEEIIEYSEENQKFNMVLSEHSFPLKQFFVEMGVKKIDENSCEILMSLNFIVKGGIFGWVMGAVLMKPMMRKNVTAALKGLAYHASTEKEIGNALPADEELSLIIQE
jgi:ribosome-associated toxin RatA of RatAB toxin-antitoxin module